MDDTTKTQRVEQVTSDSIGPCAVCGELVDGVNNFTLGVNHYLDAHGYRLLHVGQRTSTSFDGLPWQLTVAILGK